MHPLPQPRFLNSKSNSGQQDGYLGDDTALLEAPQRRQQDAALGFVAGEKAEERGQTFKPQPTHLDTASPAKVKAGLMPNEELNLL